jgi:hypothetical protein
MFQTPNQILVEIAWNYFREGYTTGHGFSLEPLTEPARVGLTAPCAFAHAVNALHLGISLKLAFDSFDGLVSSTLW